MPYSLNLDIPAFLQHYWQQKPLVIKGAYTDFIDPLSPDELAGMAMEAEISSRIVVTKADDWHVDQGPFEDFAEYGDSHWQLLVQAVNHYLPQTDELMESLRFLPDWRLDDLMVSFATPQGGVGPHIDNYDVFILQGEGRRHWIVGDKGNYKPRGNNPQSPLVEDFEPMIDVVLEPGDLLYIPPGYPHRGNTLEPSMSYSIGYRAPSQQELFGEVADFLLDHSRGQQRFTSAIKEDTQGQVSLSTQSGMAQLLTALIEDKSTYNDILGRLLSQNRFDLDISPSDPAYSSEELAELIATGNHLSRIGGLKVLRLEQDVQPRLFINGEAWLFSELDEATLSEIANSKQLSPQLASALCNNQHNAAILLDWVNQGLYYFDDEA